MPVRILKYQLEIVNTHIEQYGLDQGLPLVVPMIFYNGEISPYPYQSDIRDLCADTELAYEVSFGKFQLVDLTVMPNDEILKHGKVALLEMLEKHIRIRDFTQAVELILQAVLVAHNDHMSKGLFDSALSYLMNAREDNELTPLFNKIVLNISNYKETVMTYAEKLKQEGRQEAQKEIAKELLRSGVAESVVAKASHLSIDEIKKLK